MGIIAQTTKPRVKPWAPAAQTPSLSVSPARVFAGKHTVGGPPARREGSRVCGGERSPIGCLLPSPQLCLEVPAWETPRPILGGGNSWGHHGTVCLAALASQHRARTAGTQMRAEHWTSEARAPPEVGGRVHALLSPAAAAGNPLGFLVFSGKGEATPISALSLCSLLPTCASVIKSSLFIRTQSCELGPTPILI